MAASHGHVSRIAIAQRRRHIDYEERERERDKESMYMCAYAHIAREGERE